MKTLYIVVPCYNEEEVLPETVSRLTDKLGFLINTNRCNQNSRILFVDDGSKDRTWELISSYHAENQFVCGLKLSRNRGHQNALLAGLMVAKEYADCVISLDADLQDDIDVLDSFMDEYHKGSDIVYGVRKAREKDTFFKRTTALAFYKFMRILGADIIYNHADYRLLSKQALEALSEFKEVNLFLRGIMPLLGFKFSVVEYERNERFAGSSKYPLKKMLGFALDGITSFSIKPIRIISALGFICCIFSLIALIYSLISKLLGQAVQGWTAIISSIWLLGGIQLLCLGIIGEYIGKIYNETKARPRYIIESFLNK